MGQKNLEFVLGYVNIVGLLHYGINHYVRNNYMEIYYTNGLLHFIKDIYINNIIKILELYNK
jgi:hypothetical protein